MNRWVTLFSMTGSEIVKISEHIGRYPDLIITDNEDIESWHPKMKSLAYLNILTTISKSNSKNIKVLNKLFEPEHAHQTRITLHGWLNIIPAEICETFQIYNGHPGYINEFPELKGKDPVDKIWSRISDYPIIGSVVHEVTKDVDGGKIICSAKESSINCTTLEETYITSKRTSLAAWIDFFTNYNNYTILKGKED